MIVTERYLFASPPGGPNPAVRLRPDFPRVRARDAITRYAHRASRSRHRTRSHATATPRERIRGSSTPYLHTTAGRRAMSR